MNVRTFLESISKLIIEKIFFPKNTVVNVPPWPQPPSSLPQESDFSVM